MLQLLLLYCYCSFALCPGDEGVACCNYCCFTLTVASLHVGEMGLGSLQLQLLHCHCGFALSTGDGGRREIPVVEIECGDSQPMVRTGDGVERFIAPFSSTHRH